jgi:hypothetical protein
MFPAAVNKIFGIQYAGQISSVLWFFLAAAPLSSFLIIQFAKDFILGNQMFLISGGLTFFNLILLSLLDDKEMLSKSTMLRI